MSTLSELDDLVLKGRDNRATDLSALAKLPSLTNLSLHGLKVDDFAPVGKISTLERLRLYRVDLTDLAEITPLTRLRSLEDLVCWDDNQLTAEQSRDLRLALPDLDIHR